MAAAAAAAIEDTDMPSEGEALLPLRSMKSPLAPPPPSTPPMPLEMLLLRDRLPPTPPSPPNEPLLLEVCKWGWGWMV